MTEESGQFSPPTPKGRSTRERIKQAATELFAERGYANVRITDITTAADLSPGAFYRYFDDRRELMLELIREVLAEAYEFARSPMDEQSLITSVLVTTRRYFEFYEQHRALFGLMLELTQTDAEVAEIWFETQRSFYVRISRSLQRGAQRGLVRDDLDTEVAAQLLGSMSEFYAYQRFVLGSEALLKFSVDEAARSLAEVWVNGVGAHDAKADA